jgi:hypothetical protein
VDREHRAERGQHWVAVVTTNVEVKEAATEKVVQQQSVWWDERVIELRTSTNARCDIALRRCAGAHAG